jgi:ABC-type transport system substrate-binding protein
VRRLVAVVAALALATACTGGGDGGGRGGSGTAAATSEQPRPGGVLRVAVGDHVRSLDPARAVLPAELVVADLLFDSLTSWDAESLEARPGVAESWTVSPDQKQWEFTLRAGATFGNGRAVTPADVKFTLERVASPSLALPLADQLELVAGFGPFHAGTAPELAGVTTPAPDVVRIELSSPLAVLPEVLGNPALGIVPRESVEAASPAFADHPVGSGPFRVERREGDVVHAARAGEGSALLDGVELHLVPEEEGFAAFEEGEVDWALVPGDRVEAAAERYGREGFVGLPVLTFYGFNLRSAAFADARFREAIAHAVDREAVVQAVFGGTVRPASGVVVPGVPGAQDDPCGETCRHDPDRAQALLAEAFAGGAPPEVVVDFDTTPRQDAVARAIEASLSEIGVAATLRPHAEQSAYNELLSSGGQQLFRLGWAGLYPSPDAFLFPLFASGSRNNLTGFSSPEVDDLLARARAEPDSAARRGLYQQAERAVLAQVPVLPIAQFELHSVAAEGVRDLNLSAMGTFDGSRVWLAGGGRG